MTTIHKYPASFPGPGRGAAAAASEVCPGTRPASPASAEALIFFCFFSSIKGRKEDKKERIKEDNEERESKKKYPLTLTMTKKIIVAIDGLSSCGKSTMARELAREVGYAYIDTGAMYRAVTLYALRHALLSPDGAVDAAALERRMGEIDITFRVNPATGRSETHLNGQNVEADIRGMEVSALVSRVSALPFVRRALVAQQQAMGREKGLVMDGRDIGTVVFPQAELKVFVTASDEVRAQRRVDELRAKGTDVSMEEVLRNVRERDRLDMERAESPLRRAEDAIELDNTHLTIEGQRERLLQLFRQATEGE